MITYLGVGVIKLVLLQSLLQLVILFVQFQILAARVLVFLLQLLIPESQRLQLLR